MKKLFLSFFLPLGIMYFAAACSSGGGGSSTNNGATGGAGGGTGGSGSYIANPPSMASLATTPTTDNSGAGLRGGGTCGLSGRYAYCASSGVADTGSVRLYATIETTCADMYLQAQYYTGVSCTGSVYYTRTDHLTFTGTSNHATISGAQNIDLTFVTRTEQFTSAGVVGTNKSAYKGCPSRSINEYLANTDLVSTPTQCGGVSSIVDYNAIKVNSVALFLGDESACTAYFGGSLTACVSTTARPSVLQVNGLPFWN